MAVRIGLAGGGNITATHAQAAQTIPGVEIVAIYGTNEQNVRRLCKTHGAVPYFDWEKFLNHKPMDIVAIGSPSALHAAQGMDAARRGLHVLTEKPLDISTQRADALLKEAERSGVHLGVFFQDRFKPDLLEVKSWMDRGVLGRPILADARVKWHRPASYYQESRWRGRLNLDGGGALINQAIHTVDLLLWLWGDVASVQARMSTALHGIEAEDTLVALLEFSSGAIGSLQAATSVFPGYPRRLELTGTEGTVIIEQDRLVAADLRNVPAGWQGRGDDRNASSSSPVVSDTRGHQAVFEDFIQALSTGGTPRCTGQEARRSLALVEAIYEACRSGARVRV